MRSLLCLLFRQYDGGLLCGTDAFKEGAGSASSRQQSASAREAKERGKVIGLCLSIKKYELRDGPEIEAGR
jgi:hypothetical protein